LALSLPPFQPFPFGFRSWAKPALQKNRARGLTQAERTALCQIDQYDDPATPEIRGLSMKTLAQPSFAERIGRALGRTWRSFMRLERKAKGWLVAQGMNATLATGVLWVVRIALLGFVLYGAFWVALLLGFAAIATRAARHVDWEDENEYWEEQHKPEWREGYAGFGLYDKNEWRYDMGDPDEL
jgi:hypothetical protein